jgi:Glycosyl transferases group 1
MTNPSGTAGKKVVLFHRDFQGFTGGHLKVSDYFNHVLSTETHDARIAFSPETDWDVATNPWLKVKNRVVPWRPDKADILFLAGNDWRVLAESERSHFSKPIINLIQHPRHAEPESELRSFLRNRAVRICVSEEVAERIKATREVNGPVFTIPNGIDLSAVPQGKPWNGRPINALISGLKAKELATQLNAALTDQSCKIECQIEWMPRDHFLCQMSNARVTIFLPRPSEGFYLPALEGMACGTIVVCPDCFGNRGFCHDQVNCFRPDYEFNQIVAAARKALRQSELARDRMMENANGTVRKHSLERERKSFVGILEQIDQLWAD